MYKGILLAGGNGTRLYPLTRVISKQLLPVYDKPMIYYPLSIFILFAIKDILIISTPRDIPYIRELFGNGHKFGLNIEYEIQKEPKGLAEAFLIGEDFIGNDDVSLILGDNIFYMADQIPYFQQEIEKNIGATVFSYHVSDPERFGVIEIGENDNVLSIEEKPKNPKSDLAITGLYFYKNDVIQKAKNLRFSYRGELEITDINQAYLEEHRLHALKMCRGTAWIDAGTPKALMDAAIFVQMIEERQGLKLSCIEEILLKRGFIDNIKMKQLIDEFQEGDYKKYLQKVYNENREFYKN